MKLNDRDRLTLREASHSAFAPFGELIEVGAEVPGQPINAGLAWRRQALAHIDCDASGQVVISSVDAQAQALPLALRLLERHPLASQAFLPLDPYPWLVVVASEPSDPQAFRLPAGVGVNYRRGIWHHPLIAPWKPMRFLVVDRQGPGDNCEEIALARRWWVGAGRTFPPPPSPQDVNAQAQRIGGLGV